MKQILLILTFISLAFGLTGQDQTGEITKVVNNEIVLIQLDQSSDIEVGDMFEIRGKAETIHPATGQLVKRNNVLIGKVIVVKSMDNAVRCKVVSSEYSIKTGQVAWKVLSKNKQGTKKDVNQNRQNYVSPENNDSDYAETIYEEDNFYNQVKEKVEKQKKKKKPPKKGHFKIKNIQEKQGTIAGKINKGKEHNIQTKHPYVIFVPAYEKSRITGKQRTTGQVFAGYMKVNYADFDASEVNFTLKDPYKKNLDFVQKNSSVILYKPYAFHISFGSDLISEEPYANVNIGYDWYPNKKINKLTNYNDWLWLGADLSLHFIDQSSIPSQVYNAFEVEPKNSPRLVLALEAGFSLWKDNITGSRKLFFGIRHKFLKNVYGYFSSHYYDIAQYLFPTLFIGYEYKGFFIKGNGSFSKNYQEYIYGWEFEHLVLYLNLEIGVSF